MGVHDGPEYAEVAPGRINYAQTPPDPALIPFNIGVALRLKKPWARK